MILLRSWISLSMTIINNQVSWSILTEQMFLLVKSPESSLLNLNPMDKGHPFS